MLGRDIIDGDNTLAKTEMAVFFEAGTDSRRGTEAVTQIRLDEAKIGQHSRLERGNNEEKVSIFKDVACHSVENSQPGGQRGHNERVYAEDKMGICEPKAVGGEVGLNIRDVCQARAFLFGPDD